MTKLISKSRPVKLSDEQFFSVLRENVGIFARTARKIREQYNIEYSRQAVRIRALNNPEVLQDIMDEAMDTAEEGLHSLMRSKNERIKFKAIEFFLKMKGKERGYTDKVEVSFDNKNNIELSLVPKTDEQIAKYQDFIRTLRDK